MERKRISIIIFTIIAILTTVLLFTQGRKVSIQPPALEPQYLDETSQVAIAKPKENITEISITALIFAGTEGPKNCRGSLMTSINLPKPGPALEEPVCYELRKPARCGIFMANQEDGCEAKLFTEGNCSMFVNLAVFMPERRAVGGYFRSLSVRCGVDSRPLAPLSLPGLKPQGGIGGP
jgi:hypothetical protein